MKTKSPQQRTIKETAGRCYDMDSIDTEMLTSMHGGEFRLVELPRFLDQRGNLAVIEQFREIPFKIERCHWIYDVPGGGGREGHAYHENEELIIALSGSFDVVVRHSGGNETVTLNRSYVGLYLPRLTWRELTNFSTNAVVLVLSSKPYSDADYILDYDMYLKLRNNGRGTQNRI